MYTYPLNIWKNTKPLSMTFTGINFNIFYFCNASTVCKCVWLPGDGRREWGLSRTHGRGHSQLVDTALHPTPCTRGLHPFPAAPWLCRDTPQGHPQGLLSAQTCLGGHRWWGWRWVIMFGFYSYMFEVFDFYGVYTLILFCSVKAIPGETWKILKYLSWLFLPNPPRRHRRFRSGWFPGNHALPGAGVVARGHTSHNRRWAPAETYVPGVRSSASYSGLPCCAVSPGHSRSCLFPLPPGTVGWCLVEVVGIIDIIRYIICY